MTIGSAFVYFQIIGDEWQSIMAYISFQGTLSEQRRYSCIDWLIDWPPENRSGEKKIFFCLSHEDKSVKFCHFECRSKQNIVHNKKNCKIKFGDKIRIWSNFGEYHSSQNRSVGMSICSLKYT